MNNRLGRISIIRLNKSQTNVAVIGIAMDRNQMLSIFHNCIVRGRADTIFSEEFFNRLLADHFLARLTAS